MRLSLVAVLALFLGGCASTIAQQALNDDDAVDQIARGDFRVDRLGIYRIAYDENRNLRARSLCPSDLENQAFANLDRQVVASSANLIDQSVFDGFSLSISPHLRTGEWQQLSAEIGLEFERIPGSRRVAENVSVQRFGRDIPDLDASLDAQYVLEAVGQQCKSFLNDRSRYENRGKPVFVYAISKADNVYSKVVGIPRVSGEIRHHNVSAGSFSLSDNNDIIYEVSNNSVFGYLYFGIGEYRNDPIPSVRID